MEATHTNKISAADLQLDSLKLGSNNEEFETGSRSEVCDVTDRLASQAQRRLLLHTEDLAPEVYGRLPFLDAVRAFASRHRQSRFLVLVQDSRRVVHHGHRLIELSRQLSSSIEFRRPAPEYRHFHETFLLADATGYLHRPIASRYEGTANFSDPGKTVEWEKYFMSVWERSEPDLELKRLYL